MNWNTHSNLEGRHAFLSPSKYHWINYSPEKLVEAYANYMAAQKGTALHAYAAMSIHLGQKLPKSHKTLNMYVNDAIGYKMRQEQPLYFSQNCFGTADAICYRNGQLRIHDYKSGVTPAHMEQLMIYDALFCLEYGYKPSDVKHELRIYQSDDILVMNPHPDDISGIVDTIITSDEMINRLRSEENYDI